MTLIKGIYAASMSVLKDDLTLNINKTIEHAEMVIDNGCHGTAIFGSTGQAQLIPVSEKISLLNKLKVDFVIIKRFNKNFSKIKSIYFIEKIITYFELTVTKFESKRN